MTFREPEKQASDTRSDLPLPTHASDPHALLHADLVSAEAELIAIHRDLVRVASVNRGDGSSARETEVCAVMDRYLDDPRVERRVVESAPGRGNLLARLPGVVGPAGSPSGGLHGVWGALDSAVREGFRDGQAGSLSYSLLMIGHSDVVPSGDESAWRFPPFSAQIADGRVWGRGSNDCKMLVAAELFVLRRIARLGLPLRGELRVAIGADEEAGGAMGFGWLLEHEPDFLRADLGLNEGGGASLGRAASGESLALIGAGEKGRYEVRFRASGPGTHASTPWGRINPLAELARLALTIEAWRPRPTLESPVFERLREWMGEPGALDLGNLEATLEAARARFSTSFFNSLMAQSRTTIVPTWVVSGDKTNAIPSQAELRCDARVIPGRGRADLEAAIAEILQAYEAAGGSPSAVSVEILETAGPSVSPWDDAMRGCFERAIARTLGGGACGTGGDARVLAAPTWCTGFTDSRFPRAVGTPMYGFQFVHPDADPDRLAIHCIDESIEVSMLLPCALALAHFAVEFLS